MPLSKEQKAAKRAALAAAQRKKNGIPEYTQQDIDRIKKNALKKKIGPRPNELSGKCHKVIDGCVW